MDELEIEMARKTMSAAAVALFAAQANGLLKFPAGPLTIGEIETKIGLVFGAFMAKAEEIKAAS